MNNLRMRDIAITERPYEKCMKYGPEVLTDSELLAVILRTGSSKNNAIDVANKILNLHPIYKGINGLNHLNFKELTSIDGIGGVKAIIIMCIAELSKRISKASYKDFISFSSPKTIADYYMESTRHLTKEKVFLLMFDSKYRLIKEITVSEGTINQSIAAPRDIFIEALKAEAVYIILLHNHPSGDPSPSKQDILLTQKVLEAGSLIGIELSDHIILGNNCYVSMAERGLMYNE